MPKFYRFKDEASGNTTDINEILITNTIQATKQRNPATHKQWIVVYEELTQKVYRDEDLKMVKIRR